MNYRHAFHAGNFADVIKHIVLTRILVYLHDKSSAFRVIDTHAGAGRYDLSGDDARRGGEWQGGIGRLFAEPLEGEAASLLAPYLDIVHSYNSEAGAPNDSDLVAYPGSPLIARALLRPQDRMVACELEPAAHKSLVGCLRKDAQARVVKIDGWTALPAYVPPRERRGIVLVDPAFEQADEFARLASGFETAFAKWPTGIFVLWYPLKDFRAAAELSRRVTEAVGRSTAISDSGNRATARERCLRVEFQSAHTTRPEMGLTAAGLLVINPPWTLQRELSLIVPILSRLLGRDGVGRFKIDHGET